MGIGPAAVLSVRAEIAKSSKPRDVPLNVAALRVLKDWRKQSVGEGIVFVSPKTGKSFIDLSRQWARLMNTSRIFVGMTCGTALQVILSRQALT
jgi:integrase